MPLQRLLLTILLFTTVSCASAPTRGVRVQFKGNKVARVAVTPLWANTTFGMSKDEFRAFENRLQRRMVTDLEALGFAVVTPDALRDRLERANAWDRFLDVTSFTDEIDRYFEPSLYDEAPLEVIALKDIHGRDVLGAKALLVTELVYQSKADCSTDPRDFNRFAVVVTPNGEAARSLEPGPCAVTHFHAKLVDTESGKTMWQNRQLREYRADEVSDDDAWENAEATVTETLRGAHGLGPFAPLPATL